jgi:hypothetical protein
MFIRRILTVFLGRTTIALDEIEADGSAREAILQQVPPAAWRRASRLIDRYGTDGALALLDERAERCVDRRDLASAVRWRNVMAAIHAVSSETTGTGRPH